MQGFRNVLIIAAAPMFATIALAIMPADTFADVKSELIEGVYRIDSGNCSVGKPTPACSIYFELRGSIAQKMYMNMTSEGVADLCTGGLVKTDGDGLRCFDLGSGEYTCDVGYNFAKQKLVSGDMTC